MLQHQVSRRAQGRINRSPLAGCWLLLLHLPRSMQVFGGTLYSLHSSTTHGTHTLCIRPCSVVHSCPCSVVHNCIKFGPNTCTHACRCHTHTSTLSTRLPCHQPSPTWSFKARSNATAAPACHHCARLSSAQESAYVTRRQQAVVVGPTPTHISPHTQHPPPNMYAAPQQHSPPSSADNLPQACCICCSRPATPLHLHLHIYENAVAIIPARTWVGEHAAGPFKNTHNMRARDTHNTQPPRSRPRTHSATYSACVRRSRVGCIKCMCMPSHRARGALAPAVLLHGAQGDKKKYTQPAAHSQPHTTSREGARAPAKPYGHSPHMQTHTVHTSSRGGSAVHDTTACAAQRQPTNRATPRSTPSPTPHLSHTCHWREQHAALPTVVSHCSNNQRTAQHSA